MSVRRAALLAALAAVLAGAPATAPAATVRPWSPGVAAALRYLHHRRGDVAFAVRTPTHTWSHRGDRVMASASTIKAILLVAYLNRRDVRNRRLRAADLRLLSPMIRRSDNGAATAVRNIVGARAIYAVARRAHMGRFRLAGRWGLSSICALDMSRLFLRIDQYVPPRHRATALRLLGSIVPSQRWGIARVRPRGWHLYFKGGWGVGVGRVNHQIALLTRGGQRVSIAILTRFNGSHAYGIETLRGVAARLLRGLDAVGGPTPTAPAPAVPAALPPPGG